MGTYLNPDNINFLETANSSKYVDKSMLIDVLNSRIGDSDGKFVCISRPRRFGKTIAGNMIAAYYSKGAVSKDLFSKFKICNTDDFEKFLNKFNVIKIDLNGFYASWKSQDVEKRQKNVVSYLTRSIREEFKIEFSDIGFTDDFSLADCIQKVFAQKKETFVIIIDEYDVLVREEVPEAEFYQYLDFLNSLFKNETLKPAISLAYLTGILPIIRDKIQSKLNTFDEITILRAGKFAEYTGFTTEEVKYLCEKYDCDFEECKSWYDGYKLGKFEIYNPQSVIKAVANGEFTSYWSKTSTYEVIADKINMNFDGIRDDVVAMLAGQKIKVDVETYRNTMRNFNSKSDVFTFLIHLGYLAYNSEGEECFIPNREIQKEWQHAVENNSDYEQTNKIIKDSEELLKQTIAGNEDAVAKALDFSHIHVTSNRSYNNEYCLQAAIYLSYIAALNGYSIFKELTTGKGFADVVYVPYKKNLPALIIELKHNKSADTALSQIKERKYFDSLSHYSGDLLFVGINYDEETKIHQCKIEKFMKK